jgi:hypothetical protein
VRRDDAEQFLRAMERSGFQVFIGDSIISLANFHDVIQRELEAAARDGWVVPFVSRYSLQSDWVNNVMETGMGLGAKFLPVLIEKMSIEENVSAELARIQFFDATGDPATAPGILADVMLRLPV